MREYLYTNHFLWFEKILLTKSSLEDSTDFLSRLRRNATVDRKLTVFFDFYFSILSTSCCRSGGASSNRAVRRLRKSAQNLHNIDSFIQMKQDKHSARPRRNALHFTFAFDLFNWQMFSFLLFSRRCCSCFVFFFFILSEMKQNRLNMLSLSVYVVNTA